MFLFLIYVFVIVAVAFRSLRARHNYHSHLPEPRVVVASIRRQNTRHHPHLSNAPWNASSCSRPSPLPLPLLLSLVRLLVGWLVACSVARFVPHSFYAPLSYVSAPHRHRHLILFHTIPSHAAALCRQFVVVHFISLHLISQIPKRTTFARSFVRSLYFSFYCRCGLSGA